MILAIRFTSHDSLEYIKKCRKPALQRFYFGHSPTLTHLWIINTLRFLLSKIIQDKKLKKRFASILTKSETGHLPLWWKVTSWWRTISISELFTQSMFSSKLSISRYRVTWGNNEKCISESDRSFGELDGIHSMSGTDLKCRQTFDAEPRNIVNFPGRFPRKRF